MARLAPPLHTPLPDAAASRPIAAFYTQQDQCSTKMNARWLRAVNSLPTPSLAAAVSPLMAAHQASNAVQRKA